MARDTNLVWIDLEMTGLDPEHDVILEIACIITDSQLNVLEEGPPIVITCPEVKLRGMHEVVERMHKASGLLDAVRASSVSLREAERETMEIVQRHCTRKTGRLCGNSVWKDRIFLERYMPYLLEFLHYRLIDVTSVKELVMRWYTNVPNVEFLKADNHRALDDIKESIAELQHYRKHFFVKLD